MQDMLTSPPSMKHSIANEDSTITSNLTMDTRMDVVETNMRNLDNSVNHESSSEYIYDGDEGGL